MKISKITLALELGGSNRDTLTTTDTAEARKWIAARKNSSGVLLIKNARCGIVASRESGKWTGDIKSVEALIL